MLNLKRLILSRMERVKVCVNEEGQGGNEAGLIFMNDLSYLNDEQKSKLVEEAGLHELAYLQKIDRENYKVQFFNEREEVLICGHLSLAIADFLKKERLDNIKLHCANDVKIDLMYDDGKPYIAMAKPSIRDISQASSGRFYDFGQKKEVVLVRPDQIDDIDTIEDLSDRAVIFAAPIKEGLFKTRFFRNGKEDPFHMSGLSPLALITGTTKASFISSNGGVAEIVDKGDKYLLTGKCISLQKDLQITSRL